MKLDRGALGDERAAKLERRNLRSISSHTNSLCQPVSPALNSFILRYQLFDMKLDTRALRYLTTEDWRVLTAVKRPWHTPFLHQYL